MLTPFSNTSSGWERGEMASFAYARFCREAVAATCARRKTPIPVARPLGLDAAFADNPAKQAQRHAFLKKNKLNAPGLPAAVDALGQFLLPVLVAIRAGTPYHGTWPASGP
jgi:hypothetical protein